MAIHFQYGEKEIEHLKKVDKRLATVIDQVGMIKRTVNPDLFSALVRLRIDRKFPTIQTINLI